MDHLYAQLGRKQEQLENLHAEYLKLLDVVRRLQAGEVALDHVELTADGWRIVAPPEADTEA